MDADGNADFVDEEWFVLIIATAIRLRCPHIEKSPSLPNP